MYAVIETGGKQYRVSQGDRLDIDLLEVDPEAETLELNKVLLISDGQEVKVGAPYLEGAKVTASFGGPAKEAFVKGKKLYPTHFRRRKDSQRRIGHRQKYLAVTIDKIEG